MSSLKAPEAEWCTMPRRRTAKVLRDSSVFRIKSDVPKTELQKEFDCTEIITAVNTCKSALSGSAYLTQILSSIALRIGCAHKYTSIIALGLGSLTSPVSQLQFALYLCLCDSLLLEVALRINCGIFDPMITEQERYIYEHFGTPIVMENTKGKYRGSDDALFFLPHCPYRLYCNVLWSNWEHLERVHLIGNSSTRSNTGHIPSSLARKLRKGKKSPAPAGSARDLTVPPSVIDPADTVALLTPYLTEVDLWPSAGGFKTAHIAQVLGDGAPPALPLLVDKSVFLKEAQAVPALRHLENAVCDMSFMYLGPGAPKEVLAGLKPTEQQMDEAALNDIELF